MSDDRDLLVTLRIKVASLENRIDKVEDKLDKKYDIVIDKIERANGKIDQYFLHFWRYLATSVLSIAVSALAEYLIMHH